MDSPMLKMLKSKYPEKEYPTNFGQIWTDAEETLLLEELNNNINISTIAEKHNRSVGGINGRCRDIAYKMYLKNVPLEQIIRITKLDEDCIQQTIEKRQITVPKKIKIFEKKQVIAPEKSPQKLSIENEISEMKHEIKELKHTIKELVVMMKAVYEFEDA